MKPILAMVACVLLGGCTAEPLLIPDRGATLVPGSATVAVAQDVGVRVYVNGDAWRRDPPNLQALMTPLKLTIENHSDRPLRLAYSEMSLLGSSGFRYPALAPMTGQPAVSAVPGQVTPAQYTPVHHPAARFHHHRFLIARHYSPFYPGLGMWGQAFPYDPFYYQRYQDVWPTPLPTQDMLAEALPEGVLEAGGRVSGFVYFQGVTREEQVTFELKLIEATEGEQLGMVSVPFVVGRR